jgi:uncharacterized membrane protein (DUF4010 family)
MPTPSPIFNLLLALGLGFFFGLAFEEFYARDKQTRPGGIRSFPLLGLAGALLYRLDPAHLLPLTAGLEVLGGWLGIYYWRHAADVDDEGRPNVGLMVPICNVLAYLIGPTALSEPAWVAVGATVTAVLLLTARAKLHAFARRVELGEIVTAGKFLILTGLMLPLLPDQPVTRFTEITPHQVWLAVLAVCTVSYASYLLRRYVAPSGGVLWSALLGGMYSSTATTVVLARRARAEPEALGKVQSGIVLATAIMYLRLLAIIALFNRPLAGALAPTLVGLTLAGLAMAGFWYRYAGRTQRPTAAGAPPSNPLELSAAFIFAAFFVAISLASTWVKARFGSGGIEALAAIVGVSDIDPFVLSLAQGGAPVLPVPVGAVAILIAAASNNILKAAYTLSFAGVRASIAPVIGFGALAAGGLAAAVWIQSGH